MDPNAGRRDDEYPPRLELPPKGREDEEGLYGFEPKGFEPNGFDAPKEGFPNGLSADVPKDFPDEKDELRCHGLLLDARGAREECPPPNEGRLEDEREDEKRFAPPALRENPPPVCELE